LNKGIVKQQTDKLGVLFVCLGNICRSPLAEGLFRHHVEAAGLGDRFNVDSAGTSSYHIGDLPDHRTATVARARGIELTSKARQILSEDLDTFDYVIVMDEENRAAVKKLAREKAPKAIVYMLREFDPEAHGDLDVPDPYFGGERGFEMVHDMVDRSSVRLLEHLRERHSL
jgi:protein-tyrosine phosphatase